MAFGSWIHGSVHRGNCSWERSQVVYDRCKALGKPTSVAIASMTDFAGLLLANTPRSSGGIRQELVQSWVRSLPSLIRLIGMSGYFFHLALGMHVLATILSAV